MVLVFVSFINAGLEFCICNTNNIYIKEKNQESKVYYSVEKLHF